MAPAAAAVLRPVRIDEECVTSGPRDQDDAAGLGGGCQRAPGIAAGGHVGGQTGMPECCFFGKGSLNLLSKRKGNGTSTCITAICVADPDPSVFGPPGYGSGPDPYHQAKIVRKTLTPTGLLLLFDFLSLKNDVNVPSKSNKQKNIFFKLVFVGVLKVNNEK